MPGVKCVNENLSIELKNVAEKKKRCTDKIPLYYESHHDGDKISSIKMNTQIKQLRAENDVILDPNSDVELLSTIPLFKDWVKNLLTLGCT